MWQVEYMPFGTKGSFSLDVNNQKRIRLSSYLQSPLRCHILKVVWMNQKGLRLGHIMDNSKLISLIVLLLILLILSLAPILLGTSVFRTTRMFHAQTSQHMVQNVDLSPLQDNKDY